MPGDNCPFLAVDRVGERKFRAFSSCPYLCEDAEKKVGLQKSRRPVKGMQSYRSRPRRTECLLAITFLHILQAIGIFIMC